LDRAATRRAALPSRKGTLNTGKSKPKQTSEGFLLLVLLLSVLLTVMSMLAVRHPAVGVFQPISAADN
jgi:hypothetical protein